jgi:hypothetical protein
MPTGIIRCDQHCNFVLGSPQVMHLHQEWPENTSTTVRVYHIRVTDTGQPISHSGNFSTLPMFLVNLSFSLV